MESDPSIWTQLFTALGLISLRIALAVLVLLLFLWISGVIRRTIRSFITRRGLSPDLNLILQQIAYSLAILIGVISALGTLGIDITAMVAGLGLASFGLGLALKDVISNALSGILILAYEPFRRADRINVVNNEGEVSEINLRYTILDAGDKRILVPNSTILNNPVVVDKKRLGVLEEQEPPSLGSA